MSDFGREVITKLEANPGLWGELEAILRSRPRADPRVQADAILRYALKHRLFDPRNPNYSGAAAIIRRRLVVVQLRTKDPDLRELYLSSGCKILTLGSLRKLLSKSWQAAVAIANQP